MKTMRWILVLGSMAAIVSGGSAQPRPGGPGTQYSPADRAKIEAFKAANRLPAPAATKAAPTKDPRVVQDYRDAVIGTRAVVRYVGDKEGWSKVEVEYVRAYAEYGPAAAAGMSKGIDPGRAVQLIARDEVRGWAAAEIAYHKNK